MDLRFILADSPSFLQSSGFHILTGKSGSPSAPRQGKSFCAPLLCVSEDCACQGVSAEPVDRQEDWSLAPGGAPL